MEALDIAVSTPTSERAKPRRLPVREGHLAAVAEMTSPAFAEIVAMFDAKDQIGGAYFRIVDKGFQPVDLDALSNKPLVDIGPPFPPGAPSERLAAELDDRVAALLAKRTTSTRSVDRQMEAKVIRSALCSGLRLIGFPAELRFLASQWRVDIDGRSKTLDVVAADIATGGLVVIELKSKFDPKAPQQVAAYVAHLREHADAYGPFFGALGTAMAQLYGCPDMPASLDGTLVTGLVAWPSEAGLRFATVQ
jgi:hypothetical protein